MDLVEYRESTEWSRDRLGYRSGHAAAEELLEGLDGARILVLARRRCRRGNGRGVSVIVDDIV
jgi:hypothetical protein